METGLVGGIASSFRGPFYQPAETPASPPAFLQSGIKWRKALLEACKGASRDPSGTGREKNFPGDWILPVALSIIEIVQHRCEHVWGRNLQGSLHSVRRVHRRRV